MCSPCARSVPRQGRGGSRGSTRAEGRIDLAPGGIASWRWHHRERPPCARLLRRKRHPDLASDGQEPDRAPALEPCDPRATDRDPRPLADNERTADCGAVREGTRNPPEWGSPRPLPPADRGEWRRSTVGGEDELYRKVPDIDFYDQLRTSTDTHVAIAIRGLGEMEPADPTDFGAHQSRVDLDPRTDEYGVRRASVTLTADAAGRRSVGRDGHRHDEGRRVFAPARRSRRPGHDGLGHDAP